MVEIQWCEALFACEEQAMFPAQQRGAGGVSGTAVWGWRRRRTARVQCMREMERSARARECGARLAAGLVRDGFRRPVARAANLQAPGPATAPASTAPGLGSVMGQGQDRYGQDRREPVPECALLPVEGRVGKSWWMHRGGPPAARRRGAALGGSRARARQQLPQSGAQTRHCCRRPGTGS